MRPRTVLPKLYQLATVNQSRRLWPEVELIICHTPEGSYESATTTITNPASEVSYHVLIKENGKEARQFVRWSRKAWHARVHNSRSEGIALAGFAAETRALSPGGRALARAVAFRLRRHGLPPRWSRYRGFCRHADLQRDRSDPMPLRQWLLFVSLVKYEYRRGGFRRHWGVE